MTHDNCTLIASRGASTTKSALVDLGLAALSRGDWLVVMAITCLIQRRGMSHA
jgi:hypothetical protein